jgi:DNA-binding CsgD family transcriptional regulator
MAYRLLIRERHVRHNVFFVGGCERFERINSILFTKEESKMNEHQEYEDLQRRVKELEAETMRYKRVEEKLGVREAALQAKTDELEEMNSALKVLLKQREQDKTELEEKVVLNFKELIIPYVEKLKKNRLDDRQKGYISILESNLNEIVSPFSHKLCSKYTCLTPTEIRTAHLVKDGKTTKEIAELSHSSIRTIESHRLSIRAKMGLKNSRTNLRSYLLSL